MTCWASTHKWQYAQTGSALIRLTGTTLMWGGNHAHDPLPSPFLKKIIGVFNFMTWKSTFSSVLHVQGASSRVFNATVGFVKRRLSPIPLIYFLEGMNKNCFVSLSVQKAELRRVQDP